MAMNPFLEYLQTSGQALGRGARAANEWVNPWQYFSPTTVAGFAPGGGVVQGNQDILAAKAAAEAGNWGQAAGLAGQSMLNTGLDLLPMTAVLPAMNFMGGKAPDWNNPDPESVLAKLKKLAKGEVPQAAPLPTQADMAELQAIINSAPPPIQTPPPVQSQASTLGVTPEMWKIYDEVWGTAAEKGGPSGGWAPEDPFGNPLPQPQPLPVDPGTKALQADDSYIAWLGDQITKKGGTPTGTDVVGLEKQLDELYKTKGVGNWPSNVPEKLDVPFYGLVPASDAKMMYETWAKGNSTVAQVHYDFAKQHFPEIAAKLKVEGPAGPQGLEQVPWTAEDQYKDVIEASFGTMEKGKAFYKEMAEKGLALDKDEVGMVKALWPEIPLKVSPPPYWTYHPDDPTAGMIDTPFQGLMSHAAAKQMYQNYIDMGAIISPKHEPVVKKHFPEMHGKLEFDTEDYTDTSWGPTPWQQTDTWGQSAGENRSRRLLYEDQAVGPPVPQRDLPMDPASVAARQEAGAYWPETLYTGVPTWGDVQARGFTDPQAVSPRTGRPYKEERAIFLSNEPPIAETYAAGYSGAHGPIFPVKARMQNPLDVDWESVAGTSQFSSSAMKKVIDRAIAEGYDSAILRDMYDQGSINRQTQYLVFSPNQLRSIYAKFDPKNIDANDLTAAMMAALGLPAAASMILPEEARNAK